MSTEEDTTLVEDESMEEGSVTQEATEETEEDEEQDQGEEEPGPSDRRRSSRKKGGKAKKGSKKAKADIPDPYSATSEEVFGALGMTDVQFDYDLEEFQGITNLKTFSSIIKPQIMEANPGAIVSKMYPMFQVKYKEYQDHMAAQGKPVQKQPRGTKTPTVATPVAPPKVIPTKTRSARKKQRRDSEGPDSDQEFENFIKQQEQLEDDKVKEKEDAKIKRAAAKMEKKKEALEAARAAKKARLEQGEEVENNDFCEECKQGGELLLCDTCPRAYHTPCIDSSMEDPPEGDWSCPHCIEHGPEIVKEEPQKVNDDFCKICKETENLLLCDTCVCAFHAYCMDPPLTQVPQEETWNCPRCELVKPEQKAEKILCWRWKEIPYPDPLPEGTEPTEDDLLLKPPRKMAPRREREFFIKWKYLSYWQCAWVSEMMMEVHFRMLHIMYWRKNDSEIPPDFEESVTSRHHSDNDPFKLRERFYQYGVKPEWMQIHRIINHQSYAKSQQDYLVKWKELSYDQATWERDDANIANYEEAIIRYWQHRERMLNDDVPKNVQKMIAKQREAKGLPPKEEESRRPKKREKVDIRKKYDVQPDYVSETGGNLHPYQLEGINWLRHCWSNGTDAILADEMGLGKTVQSLTFLYTLMKEGHCKGPFLIAAPLSTIINWEREAELWCPDFYVVTYVGDRDSRVVLREHEFSFVEGAVRTGPKAGKMKTTENMKFHVLLTSYETINMDKTILSSIEWGALVVDEAHRLKNNQSLFFKNLNEYTIHYRVLLTGTPLQNNLEELFHLLNFLSKERFNQLEAFTAEFSEISKEDQIEKLHNLLGPHMLRRLKADVLTGMPSKSELIVRVELSPMQKKWYKNILTRNFDALNVKNGGTQMSLMNVLMELKKCCNHPYLFVKASLEAPKEKNGMYEGTALIKNSGKFALLQKMLRKLKDGGHRVLIFSQMTMMLDIMEDFCDVEGYKYERIDGSITGQMRQDAIDRYNAPGAQQFIFLLSTRAGGLGINLATADTVIIYDSDWNPHNDIQAFSRAHRLGQKHKVMIYRFVTKGSVEERITSVAKKKMLLNHLVVRAGLGGKEGKSMSKSELDDVLRWGTEELFKEDECVADTAEGEGAEKKSTAQEIVWDDAAVDFLLDRDKKEEAAAPEEGEGKADWQNEYLSSFKVASYQTKEAEGQEEDEEEEVEVLKEGDEKEPDPDYWEKLLKHHYEQDKEIESQKLGKGKRVRKQINYASENMGTDWSKQNQAQEDDDDNESYHGSDNGEGLNSDDDDYDERRKRRRDENSEKMPPLMAKVNGQVEILGFNPRQRKAFYGGVMRWGMPPQDSHQSQWFVRDLRNKSEKVFRAYASLFMRHLCEPGADGHDTFNDGVPREGLNRQHVLGRIGLLSLVRRKVQEFEPYNGEWSMPEVQDEIIARAANGSVEGSSRNSPRPKEVKDEQKEQEVKDEPMETSEEPSTSAETPAAANEASETTETTEATEATEGSTAAPTDEPMETEEASQEVKVETKPRAARPPFKFNICDGGFTELHSLWTNEEKVARNGKEYEIWYRRHDYWLLAGVVVHGYGRFQANFNEIINDPRFAILNEPFKEAGADPAVSDIKSKFMQRRFKLLEQGLVIEEQLRRAAHANRHLTPDNVGPLAQRFADLENIAESQANIAKESAAGNRNANAVLHKCLVQLDEILSDMKADVSRLPATFTQLSSVTERLNMTERQILSRLTTKDEDAKAGRTPLPPPGPFVTPVLRQQMDGIQPKFAALFSQFMSPNGERMEEDEPVEAEEEVVDVKEEEAGEEQAEAGEETPEVAETAETAEIAETAETAEARETDGSPPVLSAEDDTEGRNDDVAGPSDAGETPVVEEKADAEPEPEPMET
ncbi:hypothetical protein GCK72_017812 [Caenorhabditis remanei]|uniref:Uncharacterized protein n=1 Tax=Caenorhabditis remanei TaxID=31234 RepID=A0A6A5G847_CAERE|nr:hypothetical protein GCK72_017812 [Caenorhabditis remanei]KAF1751258.1 hypothetical protein GCK72_017812 [Caenorhabditis remanei]